MLLSDTISFALIGVSLWAIYCIVSSSRYKESSAKDGSLFVHLFIIILFWMLISFLSYPYSPKWVTFINVLLLLIAVLLEFEFFANALFYKPLKITKYYYDMYVAVVIKGVIKYINDYGSLGWKFVKLAANTLQKPIKTVKHHLESVYDVFAMMCDKMIKSTKIWIRCLQPAVTLISRIMFGIRKQITIAVKSLLSRVVATKEYVAGIISHLQAKIAGILQVIFDFIGDAVCKNLFYFGGKLMSTCKSRIDGILNVVSIMVQNSSHYLQKLGKIVVKITSKLIELIKFYYSHFIHGVIIRMYDFSLENVECIQNLVACVVNYLHMYSKKLVNHMMYVLHLIVNGVYKNLLYFGEKLVPVCSDGIDRIFNFISHYLQKLATIGIKIISNLIKWINVYYNDFIKHAHRILLPCYEGVIIKMYHYSLAHVQYINNFIVFYLDICSNKLLEAISVICSIWEFLFGYYTSIMNFITLTIVRLYDEAFDLIGYLVKLSMFYYRCYFANILLTKQKIDANISNRYARINYEYSFVNICKYDKSQELKFEITINTLAFISNFIADIDGKIFHSVTRKKRESLKQYQKAVKENKNAILISRPYSNIPNVFAIETNVSKNSEIKLTITIEQFIEKQLNFNQLNVELLNPFLSYNINNVSKSINFNIDISEPSGIYQFKLISPKNISINDNCKHDDKYITTTDIDDSSKCGYNMNFDSKCDYSFNYHDNNEQCTELSFEYKLKGEENESVLLFDPKSETFCHLLSNSNIMDNINRKYCISRRIVLVIDKSQSMKGNKWQQTINATVTTLNNLVKFNHESMFDKYSIILFNDNAYYKKMTKVNKKNISQTCKFLVNTLKHPNYPNGGTNINEALVRGLDVIKKDINSNCDKKKNNDSLFINQMILITDGQPTIGATNTDYIVENICNLNRELNVEIFCFGICGTNWINNLNYAFLRKLSTLNNGFDVRIKEMNALNNLNKYFKILSQPVLSNLNIKYQLGTTTDNNLKVNSKQFENISIDDITKQSFKTLYYGSDLIICGKLTNYKRFGNGENLTLNAIINAQSGHNNNNNINTDTNCYQKINIDKRMSFAINNCVSNDIENIERIWAYLHLQKSYQMMNNYNRFGGNNEFYKMIQQQKVNQKLVDLALNFNFVTPLTNMIVVEKEVHDNDDRKDCDTKNDSDSDSENEEGEGKTGKSKTKICKSVKLVVVGDSNCGKSSLLEKYANIDSKCRDLYRKNVSIDCKHNEFDINLRLFDTPKGVAKYGNFNLPSFYCRNTNGIIFVCSMDNIISQKNIEKWMTSIYLNDINMADDNIKRILIINKCDLVSQDNQVKKEEIINNIKNLSNKLGIKYFFTSVKKNININNPFQSILHSICMQSIEESNCNLNDNFHSQDKSSSFKNSAQHRSTIELCDEGECMAAGGGACC